MREKIANLLIIAYNFPPFGNIGWCIRITKFVKYLPLFAWEPIVLTIKKGNYLVGSNTRSLLSELPTSIKIYRTKAPEPPNFVFETIKNAPPNTIGMFLKKTLRATLGILERFILIPDRQILWLPNAFLNGIRIIRKEKIDTIIVTCPPHSAALIGALLSLFTKKPLIFDFRDEWITPIFLRNKPIIIKILECRLEKMMINRASKIIFPTEWMLKDFQKKYPSQVDKFICIYNGFDSEDMKGFNNSHDSSFNRNIDNFKILYGGALYENRTITGLVNALRDIRYHFPKVANRIKVFFFGDICEKHRHELSSPELQDTVILGNIQSHPNFLRLSFSASVHLVIIDNNYPAALTGKIFESWALGKPVLLLAHNGVARDFVLANNLGLVAAPDDPEQIEKCILQLFDEFRDARLLRPCQQGLEKYDRKYLTSKLAVVLDNSVISSC